jgi:cell division protein FtsN
LGVFGAVYLQRADGPQIASNAPAQSQARPPTAFRPEAQPLQAVAPSENRPQEQAATPPESTSPPPMPPERQTAQAPPSFAPAPSKILSQTQTTNSLPSPEAEAQHLAEISPSAGPADIAAAGPRYWVEFGAYNSAFYADRLKQNLGQVDIDAMVASASGKYGRTYLRVRTTDDSDHATATAQLTKARSALTIAPLLHRAGTISPMPPRLPEAQTMAPSHRGYWVQFGAFREQQNAEQTLSALQESGIQASVIERKDGSDGPLYLIRISRLASRAQAEQVAQQGSAALHSNDVMIRESRGAASGLHPHLSPG